MAKKASPTEAAPMDFSDPMVMGAIGGAVVLVVIVLVFFMGGGSK